MNARMPSVKAMDIPLDRPAASSAIIRVASLMRREGQTGLQTHVRAVLAAMQKAGRTATLVTPFDPPWWQVVPVFGLRKLVEPVSSAAGVWWHEHWHKVFLERMLRMHLQGGEPCVVYAQCPPSAQAALAARRGPQQRVVMVVHFNESQADEWAGKGLIAPDGRLFRAIRAREHQILHQVDGLVFVSDYMRRQLCARYPEIAQARHAVVPNFIADPQEPDTAPAGRPHRESNSIDADLINIGTLEPRKNQAYLLHIVAAARRRGVSLRVTLVGDGPDHAMLRASAATLGIADLVRFAGFIPDAAGLISKHRAYIHVARLESLPLVLIEALAHGVPVFAPAVGGIPEMFVDGVEGSMVPLDDADAAAATIIQRLESASGMAAAAAAARQRFLDCFESKATAARLAAFLDP